ncbi:hypothetical protein V6N11_036833 [Hibiscus sabdariffa]|uniref:Uncharacterized protein n=1 Tax=Hibiscus sabdariffa TaxID=183260 RepID=A0ABR2RBK6_9ROSI
MLLGPLFQKLRNGFSTSAYSASPALNHSKFDENTSVSKAVPGDVKEGIFAVFAVKGKEIQSFVIELDHITNPEFQSLLDQAREEYELTFQQKGVLSVPSRPHELQEILEHGNVHNACSETYMHIKLSLFLY